MSISESDSMLGRKKVATRFGDKIARKDTYLDVVELLIPAQQAP
jgi:hypothetical protein